LLVNWWLGKREFPTLMGAEKEPTRKTKAAGLGPGLESAGSNN